MTSSLNTLTNTCSLHVFSQENSRKRLEFLKTMSIVKEVYPDEDEAGAQMMNPYLTMPGRSRSVSLSSEGDLDRLQKQTAAPTEPPAIIQQYHQGKNAPTAAHTDSSRLDGDDTLRRENQLRRTRSLDATFQRKVVPRSSRAQMRPKSVFSRIISRLTPRKHKI